MRAIAVILVLAGLAVAGCGPDDEDLIERRPVVTDPGSSPELGATPGATALAWWEALRARDPEAVVGRLAPATRRTIDVDRLERAMRLGLGRFAEASEPHVLYTERRAGGTTVYMRIDAGGLVGPALVKGGSLFLALPFVASDGSWLIENAAWVRTQVNHHIAVTEFNRRLRRESKRQQAREEREDGE